METVLHWLGMYHVPVIMLSATLPQEKRETFLKAYQDGYEAPERYERLDKPTVEQKISGSAFAGVREARTRKSQSLTLGAEKTFSQNIQADDDNLQIQSIKGLDFRYPLLSISSGVAQSHTDNPESSGRATDIAISILDEDDTALVKLLTTKLSKGGCAAVICNTVNRAQHIYELLKEHLDVDVILDHSRFLGFDRARIDREIIERYGKRSTVQTRTGVVVATQVIEQSLDVDFDLMITDIAPVDLILQRAGRLHRHHRGENESDRPEPLRHAELYITGILDWYDDAAPQLERGAERIYSRSLLLRSLAVLDVQPSVAQRLSTPDDIPQLIQRAYAQQAIGPQSWQSDMQAADAKLREKLSKSQELATMFRIFRLDEDCTPFNLDSWLESSARDPDANQTSQELRGKASVRDGDDSFEVIVLCQDAEKNLELPPWGDFTSEALPTQIGGLNRQQAHDILSSSISLGSSALHYIDIDAAIASIEEKVPPRWWEMQNDPDNKELQGQLLIALDSRNNAIFQIPYQSHGKAVTKTLMFHYSPEKGLETYEQE
jgi:CRISPR-associated endonuclease/helicase Cas3